MQCDNYTKLSREGSPPQSVILQCKEDISEINSIITFLGNIELALRVIDSSAVSGWRPHIWLHEPRWTRWRSTI
jgi:hypothetical protein